MMEEKCDHEAELDEIILSVCRGGIKRMPTVDAVEVVRCKDCNFFIDKEDPTYPAGKWESIDGICWRDRKFTCHDDYCSCGAKIDGDKNE